MGTHTRLFARLTGGAFFAFAFVASATPAFANGQATVKTTVISPLSLVKDADLSFGDFVASPTAGTVTVSPAGSRTSTGGVTGAGGTISAARFQGQGSTGDRVRIKLPSTTSTLTRVGGGATMNLRDLNFVVDGAISLGRGNSGLHVLGLGGAVTIRVGGTLDVAANQQAGSYEGTFDVRMDYF